ncbi:hypothetical protein COCVIDRAFT_42864 [Bipolaris victoriae FI3]|uniref:PD-(D/E)XK nuclease-like domain-containing protein n=1 Tax=Bipolaris victoriae (strain FI3) TaxID=930091 RepID=W7E534_BIPV3|nr:hypothetical protein COCVIDRAFT_42864 [Bipolaris victoriae FI3]
MPKHPRRAEYGATPAISKISSIVSAAWQLNSGTRGAEDEWNTEVQYQLLKIALETSRHSKALSIRSVETARIDPPALCNHNLPGRVIDYVVCLQPDSVMSSAYRSLRPLASNTVMSWNHVTYGKPQIGIWTNAWLRQCELLWEDGWTAPAAMHKDWPAIPVPISQGHDWHLLVVTKTNEKLVFREQIVIGSTRNCFDALKVVAVLHWLLNWA